MVKVAFLFHAGHSISNCKQGFSFRSDAKSGGGDVDLKV